VHSRLLVAQVEIEKVGNKNIEIGFQSAFLHLLSVAASTSIVQ